MSSPAQIEYLDLMPKRGQRHPLPVPLEAVVEHQGVALLYLVDGHRIDPDDKFSVITELQHQLANRSDPAYLGVVTGGSLDIYPIEFRHRNKKAKKPKALQTVQQDDRSAPLFFQSLVHGKFGKLHKEPRGSDHVYRIIMALLDGTTAEFGADPKKGGADKLPPLEVLSLAGRALFFRFLVDRGVVLQDEAAEICPSAPELRRAFASAAGAAEVSAWLDQTFNGDFLPLIDEEVSSEDREARLVAYLRYYHRAHEVTGGSLFIHLDAILRGWDSLDGKNVQMTFDFGVDWSGLNFAHIPVGVLSQVYENFSHRVDSHFAKSTSVYYTPRAIARFVVDEAFDSLEDPTQARVLDPACGAGIFLVLALRRMVRERWQRDGRAPNAETIRQILYKQLCGFDISESALRLAALGLYIAAIEVNQSPRPPKSLRFPRNLRDAVLFNFNEFRDQPGMETRIPLGSLGAHVAPGKFDGRFDLVIGNPPWTALRAPAPVSTAAKAAERKKLRSEGKGVKKEETTQLNDYFTGIGRRVLERRALRAKEAGLETDLEQLAAAYKNPAKDPDLPFLWRATEWATDGGTIALVLPARLYLLGPQKGAPGDRDTEGKETARDHGTDRVTWLAVMQGVAVTGVINGSDLRETDVWRNIKFPFALFFAKNDLPLPRHAFRFASPCRDTDANRMGCFRLDYQNDVLVTCREVQEKTWLLKTLALGSSLDVSLVERLLGTFPQTLGQFWAAWDTSGGDRTGQGFNLSPNLTPKPGEFLARLPVFERPSGFVIDYKRLVSFREKYGRESAYWPKTELLYQAPLVILAQAPGEEPHAARAFISDRDLAFSQSFYGYSCKSHPEAETLAALIYLVSHSLLSSYFLVMISSRYGVDRRTFNKEDIDAIPFPDPANLSAVEKERIVDLARRLQTASEKPWKEINALFAELYGLSEMDCELMADTLFSIALYREKGAEAFDPPMLSDVLVFADCLEETLQPFLAVTGRIVETRPADFPQDVYRAPWYFVEVTTSGRPIEVTPWLLEQATAVANELGSSRVVLRAEGDQAGLLLGQIAQRRWWTKTRARLCATHIIHNHLDTLRPSRRKK